MRFRNFQAITIMLALFAAVFIVGRADASASSGRTAVYGDALTGQDPYVTKCASKNAVVINSAPLLDATYQQPQGMAYLWYSNDCGTVWISVTTNIGSPVPGQPSPIVTNVYRQTPYNAQEVTWTASYPAGTQSWSRMIFAPISCVKGYASIQTGYDTASAWIYQSNCRF